MKPTRATLALLLLSLTSLMACAHTPHHVKLDAPASADEPKDPTARPGEDPEADNPRKPTRDEIAASSPILKILGTTGDSTAIVDVFSDTDQQALDDLLDNSAGVAIAQASPRDEHAGSTASIADIKPAPAPTLTLMVVEAAFSAVLDESILELRLQAIPVGQCARRASEADQKAGGGSVTLEVTVGSASRAEVIRTVQSTLSQPLSECLGAQLKKLRYPTPTQAPAIGTVTFKLQVAPGQAP